MSDSVTDTTVPRILLEYLPTTTYNIRGLSPYVIKAPKLRQFLYQHTGRKIYLELNSLKVAKWLEGIGLTIIASGSDGSKSSWIIAIDPRNEEHVKALEVWCSSRDILLNIINNLHMIENNPDLKDALGGLYSAVNDMLIDCMLGGRKFRECVNEVTGFTIIIDDDIYMRLANSKVKLRIDPCELLRVIK